VVFTRLTLALSTLRGAMLWSERETEYLMSHPLKRFELAFRLALSFDQLSL